jgi:hypothetical protein
MSMKATMFGIVGTLALLGGAAAAEARPHDWSYQREWDDEDAPRKVYRKARAQQAKAKARTRQGKGQARTRYAKAGSGSFPVSSSYKSVGPRPGAWCGWWMRTQRGGGPEYNLAWTWSRWGKPTEPKVGAVVVWRHHVGEITGRTKGGQWIVRSGNDGGRVRERVRSVAGAVFRIQS